MTQISRPFQIALVALVLFIALWFVVLRGHSSSATSSSTPAASSASSGAQSNSASPSSVPSGSASSSPGGGTQASKGTSDHGSAPGVAGLSRAIQRARGAVTQSQQNAQQLQRKSAQASDESPSQGASTSKAGSTGATSPAGGSAAVKQAPTTVAKAKNVPAMQAAVEAELKQGKVVAVLFWNSKGTVDGVVRGELQSAGHKLHGKLAVHVARPSQVGSFGSFTHAVQVYSTPTILLINVKGGTSSLTGLTDSFSIEQAIREVKSATAK